MPTHPLPPNSATVVVSRDDAGVWCPDGTPHHHPQEQLREPAPGLWRHYTVTLNGNMARIDGTDADAIGQAPLELDFDPPEADGSVREADLNTALGTIFDPEIPVNILDLGLVYGCDVIRREDKNVVQVRMTLTAPNCGMGPVLVGDVEDRLAKVPNVDEVEVALLFDPPWSRDMMTEEAQLELGLF